jgi:enediyne biosynthesis protein E4
MLRVVRAAIIGCLIGAGTFRCASRESPTGFVDLSLGTGILDATWSGTSAKAHIRETLGQGACWIDAEQDGDLDLFFPNDSSHRWLFYLREGDRFVDRALPAGLAVSAWGIGCAVADVDGDGRDDLFVTTAHGPNRLFRSRGDGSFEDVTSRSGLGRDSLSTGAAFGDLDLDGDLDLVVANYLDESRPPPRETCKWKGTPVMCGPKGYPMLETALYLNDGSGRFVDQSERIAGHPSFGLGVVLFDPDLDGDLDVYVAGDSSRSRLFLNRGGALLEEAALGAGVGYSETGALQAGMGVEAADLDGDGRADLLKTNFSDDINNFFRNRDGTSFIEWSHRSGLAAPSVDKLGWAILAEDFDLDMDLDLLVVNGHVFPEVDRHDPATRYRQPAQLFFNDGSGRFAEDSARSGAALARPMAGRSAAVADFDRDGDADLVITRDGEPPLLLQNDLTRGMNALRVELIGPRGNPHAIGARVELFAKGKHQVRWVTPQRGYLGSSECALTFGLADAELADRLVIQWPGGSAQEIVRVPANHTVVARPERFELVLLQRGR